MTRRVNSAEDVLADLRQGGAHLEAVVTHYSRPLAATVELAWTHESFSTDGDGGESYEEYANRSWDRFTYSMLERAASRSAAPSFYTQRG